MKGKAATLIIVAAVGMIAYMYVTDNYPDVRAFTQK